MAKPETRRMLISHAKKDKLASQYLEDAKKSLVHSSKLRETYKMHSKIAGEP
jgi:hypothetical protein